MQVFFCDDTADNVDPDFDAALFVIAKDADEAAKLWRAFYERGELPCRVTIVPTMHKHDAVSLLPGRAIEWDTLKQVIA